LVLTPLAGVWLCGLVLFLASPGNFEMTLPRQRQLTPELQNLSRWDLGPTVRASSYYADWINHHHPAFLVDDKGAPDLVEKWASAQRDEHPWIELLWRETHSLDRVEIRHAGVAEGADLNARRYRIVCLRSSGLGPALEVDANSESIARHELHCDDARGVRIEFERHGTEIVRVYEVETWGR
jgi:hypothetical protein